MRIETAVASLALATLCACGALVYSVNAVLSADRELVIRLVLDLAPLKKR